MTIQTYQVQAGNVVSTLLSVGLPTAATFYNPSTVETVYISDTTGGTFFPVPPGTTVTWDAGKTLYAKCINAVTVYLFDNEGQINNPAILAQLITDSGLAQDIATNVNLQGVPPINKLDLLDSVTWTFGGSGDYTSQRINMQNYQSLQWSLYEPYLGYATPTVRRIAIYWFADDTGVPLLDRPWAVDDFYMQDDGSDTDATTTISIPVRAPYAFVFLDVDIFSRDPVSVTSKLYGSYQSVNKVKYIGNTGRLIFLGAPGSPYGSASAGVCGNFVGTKVGGVAYMQYLPCVNGPATLDIFWTTVTTAGTVGVRDQAQDAAGAVGGFYGANYFPVSTTPSHVSIPLQLPGRPLLLALDKAMAGTGFRWSLTFDPN